MGEAESHSFARYSTVDHGRMHAMEVIEFNWPNIHVSDVSTVYNTSTVGNEHYPTMKLK